MAKHPTTIRLDPALRRAVLREAKKSGLSFSDVVLSLLEAFSEGSIRINMQVTQYPPKYLEKLEKEADKLHEDYLKGKVKGYTSTRKMFDDILKE